MTIHQMLEQFGEFRKSGAGWITHCPGPNHSNGDRKPSLSVSEGDGGRVLLHCFAGCTTEEICAAKGWNLTDLFMGNNGGSQQPQIVAVYDYIDESGKLLFQNVRYEPKEFRARRPDGNGGWIWTLEGVRRVPYHLPEMIAADFVLIVEGEKDADTAAKLGMAATSSKHWRPEFSDFLHGRRVAVIADADDPGRKTAADVAQKLTGKTASLKVFELPGSKDLSDWVSSGGNKDALLGFIEAQPEWKPSLSWRDMFHCFEDFENAPPLSFAIRDLLQNDGATLIGGLSGHGKTLIMLSMAKALLAGYGTKLWGHFDVLESDARVIYLIPEAAIGPFGHRLKLFKLYDHLRSDRLLVRTLSKGPAPCLSDPRILAAAKGAHIMLDTAIRFANEGNENDAGDNQRGLATDFFALLGAGARTVVGAHHSPKPFSRENVMRLENVLRGSGDIGAMVSTAWGIKQLDADQNIIHVENIKPGTSSRKAHSSSSAAPTSAMKATSGYISAPTSVARSWMSRSLSGIRAELLS